MRGTFLCWVCRPCMVLVYYLKSNEESDRCGVVVEEAEAPHSERVKLVELDFLVKFTSKCG